VGGERLGVQGSPEIRERDAGLRLDHRDFRLKESPGKLLAVASPSRSGPQRWFALNDRHELIAFSAESNDHKRLRRLDELGFPNDHDLPLTLLISPAADFAVIASTYGSHGVVADLRSGKTALRLNRQSYHVEYCRFPVAFFGRDGRTLLVHATDWNRLNISDPSNGEILTARNPTSYVRGEEQPEHYLDYFHSGLSVSPDFEWIADNGWIWHPVGAVDTWSLKNWLITNVWESEDGMSKRRLCWRDYYWDGPLCWVGSRTLAVWGHGDDADLMIPGIRLFDVESGKELPGFAGPVVRGSSLDSVTSNGKVVNISHTSGTLMFDEYLFSYDIGCEFAVWDVATGERLFRDESFYPLGYDSRSKTFLSQNTDDSVRFTNLLKD
jgi:hypothetical protein